MTLSKKQRLDKFYERLQQASPAASVEEAIELVRRTLTEVENEFSGIVEAPEGQRTDDGRMYPPEDDARRETSNPDVTRYRSARHNTRVGSNGAIQIVTINGEVQLSKPGADGRQVSDL